MTNVFCGFSLPIYCILRYIYATWAEASTIFSVKRLLQVFDLNNVLSAFKEGTSAMAMVYIEPNDGGITDGDSADEDDSGLVDNLSGIQLNTVVKAL